GVAAVGQNRTFPFANKCACAAESGHLVVLVHWPTLDGVDCAVIPAQKIKLAMQSNAQNSRRVVLVVIIWCLLPLELVEQMPGFSPIQRSFTDSLDPEPELIVVVC